MSLIIAAIMSAALAGPLADGYKGLKWGEYESFPAPTENCRRGNEPGIGWICSQSIGETAVETAYAYNHNIFYAVVLAAKSYSTCNALMDTLEAGWGPSKPFNKYATGKMDKRAWRDKDVFASWQYDKYHKECNVYMIHNSLMGKMENIEKAAAAKGVQDL
jgi:hypothetical protein